MTDHPQTTHPGEHPERHEHSDAKTRPLLIGLLSLLGVAIVVHVGLYFLFVAFDSANVSADESSQASFVKGEPQLPPPGVPRLQGSPSYNPNSPAQDMREMLKRVNRELTSYGATTQPGRVRIPIERAIELSLDRATALFPTSTPSSRRVGGAGGGTDATR